MQKRYRILIINPKTTTTIISIFHNEMCIFKQSIHHHSVFKNDLTEIDNEVMVRKKEILQLLIDAGINMSKLDAVAANGGLLRPVEGGTYEVTEDVLIDLKNSYNGKHASNLGGILAYEIAHGLNIPAFFVDPPVVDELSSIAKLSGLPGIERKSIFHALNQKAVARQAAQELHTTYEKANLIVAHLGNGITIGAHERGKVIDVNNGLHGDGPFSLERAGTIPSEALIELCFSGQYSKDNLIREITYKGGIKAYLHTDNVEEIEKKINQHDPLAKNVFEAMAYQIAKEIGSMATVLGGMVDGVVLTGELSHSKKLTEFITERVHWIADIFIYPGEYDLQALNAGTLRVLRKEESAKKYIRNL
ncbi:butyrate kinase [Pseudogracilibacillus auburnensis]|uniref:Probable butyrate kinase n=1 Tax=Pseudogracilibacillus auburnensis TaxID=1494959 RepID=A0A2V3VTU7_9BACI|nr:butyrate kinase [Pseudogracilibacillus auburnensis]MBO1004318.1 butyrate kinase [Pseudogracilibacillus auburnensis]PXW85070.1 butyrate kinase [Pseudogracilibacillus auburnensis]